MEVICYACGKGEYPENTLEAIQNCQNANPKWRIEMDIQLTSDGHIVLFHDEDLKRITGDDVKIKDLSLYNIKTLNAGYNFKSNEEFPFRNNKVDIPTLDEVFDFFPYANFLLDIHTDDLEIVPKLISLIDLYNKENQVIIVTKNHKIKQAIRNKRPNWIFGASTKEVRKLAISSKLGLEQFISIPSNIIMIPEYFGKRTILNNRILKYVQNKNKKLWLWIYEGKETVTINSLHEYYSYQSKGANGIFTMYPNKLKEELA